MKTIKINFIPHKQQRYPTPGDWFLFANNIYYFNISKMGNEDYEFLVALHEMIEWYLCRKRKISQKDVDAFDIKYEKERAQGKHAPDDEPGDDPKAPYRKEHAFATVIERLMAHELGVDWDKYDSVVNSL